MNQPEAKLDASTVLTINRSTFFWVFWTLWSAMMVGFIWNARPSMSPNDNARWDTAWSLVEYRTYEIFDTPNYNEKQQFPTIDKVVRAHDGKVISSKPPLLPTVIAGFVEGVKWVLHEPIAKDVAVPGKPLIPGSFNIYAKAVLFAFNVLPMMLMLWLYRRFLDRHARTSFAWTFSLLTMGLGTLVTGYVVTLNNHVVAATWGFIATYNLMRIWYEGRDEWWRFALVGLLTGWTAANELPAALFVIAASLLLLWKNATKTLLCFLPPLALVMAAFFYTNYLAIGDPNDVWKISNFKPAYLQKALYQSDIHGQESYWKTGNPNRSPIDALNDHPEPKWLYFLHSTIGHHGIFSLSPVLLFCLWGFWRNLSGKADESKRRLAAPRILADEQPPSGEEGPPSLAGYGWILGLITLVVLCFYLFITDQRNYGGFCHGLRWMLWLTPMWLVLLPGALDDLSERRWLPPLAWFLLAVSILSVFDTWYNPWTRSWLHRILRYFGVIDY